MTVPRDITQQLLAVGQGHPGALDRLMPMVFDQLRLIARGQLRGRGPDQTLNTGALVNEVYLKLVDQTRAQWQDRNHFYKVAAVAMRHILVDHARRRLAQKRGGDQVRVTLDDRKHGVEAPSVEVLDLEKALTSLGKLSRRLVKLVELRFYAGLTIEDTAQVLEVSEKTVRRDWKKARLFLYRELNEVSA